MHRSVNSRRGLVAALVVAVFALTTVACTASGGGGGSTGPTQSQFCDLWNAVAGGAPPASAPVLVKDDVVASSQVASRTGSDCGSASSKVNLDGATLSQGQLVPTTQGGDPGNTAAVTGDQLGAGTPVLENIQLTGLGVEIGLNGITIRGTLALTISGAVSSVTFAGTLTNLDIWSISIVAPALNIPGFTVQPLSFKGTFSSVYGHKTLTLGANAPLIQTGDITVANALVKISADDVTGLDATVSGDVEVGPSTASGTVDVSFDRFGTLVNANVDLDAHLVGTQPDGKTSDLTGHVSLEGNQQHTTVDFSASGHLGDLQINAANGTLTLDNNHATFTGLLDIQQGNTSVRFNATLDFDGSQASFPQLSLPGLGSESGTTTDGEVVAVNGSISVVVQNGQTITTIDGDIQLGTMHATGHAVVNTVGSTTTMVLTGTLADTGYSASLNGSFTIVDGVATAVDVTAGLTGPVVLGDITVTNGNMHITSNGGPLTVTVNGTIKSGNSATLTGTLVATIGPDGQLLSLTGNGTGSLALDTWGVLSFQGTVNATAQQLTVTGTGNISSTSFPVSIPFSGSFTSTVGTDNWTLSGVGRLKIGPIDSPAVHLTLSKQNGMTAVRVGLYIKIAFIPTYFEVQVGLLPTGGCSGVKLVGGAAILWPIAKIALEPAIGCAVTF
jgi:hypothetical protein